MKRFFLLTAVLVFFAFTLTQVLWSSDEQVQEKPSSFTTATLRDFQITVKTLGTLEAVNAYFVSSSIKGAGAKVIYLAPDGYPVKKGDVLVRFDPTQFEEIIAELSAQIDDLSAGVNAAEQLLEWEKTELAQRVTTSDYNLKVARLEFDRLVQGEGPITLTQYQDERDKAQSELKRYQDYVRDLKLLADDGYSNPAEISRGQEKIDTFTEQFASADRRYKSYRDLVLPSLTESSKAKVENAKLAYQQIRQAGVHKIARAQAAIQQVMAKLKAKQTALEQAESELDKTVLRAPFDGLLIHHESFYNGEMRTVREGDTVIINSPILYLPDIESLIVKSTIREIDLHKVAIGQSTTITVEAYPDISFPARLSFIGALAKKRPGRREGEKYFQVHFSFDRVEKKLRPGMSARIIIETANLQQALSLPVEAVFHDSSGHYCYVKNGSKLVLRRIHTGYSNENFIEVTDGLKAGETVSMIHPVIN
ncbi:RND family efflux transporter, MFP subunit [Desulfocapsa sulfexigens DSM 10523]|uniref:RND family efflux transporter, MFP subunit n=1 Tax=Desulfocapsa sulfexigens (strain DSM 10523 / SB164P1) TaxID=1167006 RepID=M1PSB8_DESSD|nr:efflux RND transporter periplasmic adaptor subunit [Desulfocapsa sulfexigens]AGF79251.1 RND family efflux transporter, MFP subunit [Desulfocapsa sulfexigens DSM 10523]